MVYELLKSLSNFPFAISSLPSYICVFKIWNVLPKRPTFKQRTLAFDLQQFDLDEGLRVRLKPPPGFVISDPKRIEGSAEKKDRAEEKS